MGFAAPASPMEEVLDLFNCFSLNSVLESATSLVVHKLDVGLFILAGSRCRPSVDKDPMEKSLLVWSRWRCADPKGLALRVGAIVSVSSISNQVVYIKIKYLLKHRCDERETTRLGTVTNSGTTSN